MVLEGDVSAVAIADLGDDLVIGAWPDSGHWTALGVELDE